MITTGVGIAFKIGVGGDMNVIGTETGIDLNVTETWIGSNTNVTGIETGTERKGQRGRTTTKVEG